MPSPVLIHVAPVTPVLARGVRAVEVAPEQVPYVGNIAFNLQDAESDPLGEPMAILANGRVIGFYRLDLSAHAVIGRTLGTPHIGVRSFAIDHRHQGKGYGRLAITAMSKDVQTRHPDRRLIVLAVHCRNRLAIGNYRYCGFVPLDGFVPGGRAGPQQIMIRYQPGDER